ncbi:MAG: hypothetical protein MK116_01700 [Phycisphaerales bacterium]|nr:hypothetical protein [Phycisphaerales bacterium]
MRKDTYLNVVLTVIAVLLTVDVWTRVAQQPFPGETAVAQSRSQPNRAGGRTPAPTGVSAIGREAIQQRDKMIQQLTQIREQFVALRGLLESGGIAVKVSDGSTTTRGNTTRRR